MAVLAEMMASVKSIVIRSRSNVARKQFTGREFQDTADAKPEVALLATDQSQKELEPQFQRLLGSQWSKRWASGVSPSSADQTRSGSLVQP